MKSGYQFPHFSHRIPAQVIFSLEMSALWLALAVLIAINVWSIQKSRPAYWNKLMVLFASPRSVSGHTDLAADLWRDGQKEPARRLMAAAQELSPSGNQNAGGGTVNVLGMTTSPKEMLLLWEHETETLHKEYASWQTIAARKPDYRDAHIQLAILAYQLDDINKARDWLEKAHTLDPNSPAVRALSAFLGEK